MKKLFSIISLFALAAILGISTVSAQKSIVTLEKLWSKTTTEMGVSVTDSRQSAGRDGKVYLLNKANQSFVAISETSQDTIFQGPLTISEGVTANLDGTAFALDDAGNFVMVGAFNAIPSHIILRKADGSVTKDLSIEGIARTDFINVSGDVFSAEGGYVFVYGYSSNLLVYQIAAGELVTATEIAVPGCINGDYVVMGDVNTQIVHHRMAYIHSWMKIEDNTETPIEGMEGFKPTTMGGDIITLVGKEFYIYPTGTTHYDSEFCVRNMTDGTFVVDKADGVSTTFTPNASETINKTIFACWLHAEKIDDNNAYIYVYNSQGAAVYKLSIVETAIVTLDVNDATMGTVEGGGKIVVGENTTVKAIPQLGHSFVYWLNGTEVVSTDAEYTFAVTSDVTLTAVFQAEENKTLTLSVNDFDMGHIILPSGITLGENSVAYGQTVTLKAVPAKRHHFVRWSDDNTETPRTIIITSDTTLTAEFAFDGYQVALSVDETGMTGEIPTQEELWANFNSAAGFGLGELNTISKVNTIAGVATAENLTAGFAKPEWQWLKEYIMTVQNAQKGNTIPGSLKPDGTERTVLGLKEDIALSLDNTGAWRFAVGAFFLLTQYTTGWPGTADFSESGKPEAWGSAYQAAFNLNGIVTGSGVYQHGATATLTATPNEGYHFVQWSDGNTDNPRTMTIISDITLSAEFAINVYSVRFLDYDGTELKTDSVEYQSAATAPADPTREGYTFIGWDKDFSHVTDHMTVTAQYQINRYRVRFFDYDNTLLKTDSVEYQAAATAPANPYREGYTFIGWNQELDSITADLDVHAQYEFGEDRDMTIVFTNSEDNNSEIYSQSLTIKVPAAPEIVGFTFLYWQPVAEPLTDRITIQAIYKADTLTSATELYVNPANPAQKLLRNGHVYILRDGNTYTIQGQKL